MSDIPPPPLVDANSQGATGLALLLNASPAELAKRLAILVGAIIALLILVLLTIGAAMLGFQRYLTPKVTLTSLKTGAFEFSLADTTSKSVFFPLPASSLWADSGIRVHKGDSLGFQIGGAVNMAGHRLLQAGEYDIVPPHSWISWPGAESGHRPIDRHRANTQILPEAPYGSLLAYIACDGGLVPSDHQKAVLRAMREPRFRTENVHVVASSDHFGSPQTITSRCDGALYLTLNENLPLDFPDYVRDYAEYQRSALKWTEHRPSELLAEVHEWGAEAVAVALKDLRIDPALDDATPTYDMGEVNSSRCFLRGANEKQDVAAQCPCLARAAKKAGGADTPEALAASIFGVYGDEHHADCVAALMRRRDCLKWYDVVDDYPRLWFDENVGSFLVAIEVESE
jgi:hypothetical protein